MKKIMLFGIMLIVMVTMSFAAPMVDEIFGREASPGATLKYLAIQKQKQNEQKEVKKIEAQYQNMETKVTGLENAQLRVRNEEQKQLLEKIMEKIQEKKREQLNKLEGLEIKPGEDNNLEATGKKEKRFLGIIPWKIQEKYKISAEGELERVPGGWDFLFTEVAE